MIRHLAHRLAVAATASVLGLSACATSDAYTDNVECVSSTMVLMAQAIPDAQAIPCLAGIPIGWSISTIEIGNDSAEILFDSQTAGHEAAPVAIMAGWAVGVLAGHLIDRATSPAS